LAMRVVRKSVRLAPLQPGVPLSAAE
jgi:hypothetical protein